MQYMDYGQTGLRVSRFGFGCMRFPKIRVMGKEQIDQDETTRMVRYALDHGVNYFDTAHVYEGSEVALGTALEGIDRESVVIVGKNPVWDANNREDLERFLDEELARLKTDYLDVQFLHALNGERWKKCQEMGALEYLDDMKKKGRIRHAGFSFHGKLEDFKRIVDSYDWDIVQIQLNFLDVKHQAGLEGMYYAAEKGLPVVVMEPLRGGALAEKLPSAVSALYKAFPVQRSGAEWSFRWLIDLPEVTSVLSGVSTMEQLKENIEIFSKAEPGCMTKDEKELIDSVVDEYKKMNRVGCTRCGYCMPCPSGVNIPEVFQSYNDSVHEEYLEHTRFNYREVVVGQDKSGGDQCVECGLCEPKCPQSIPIIRMLKEAHQALINQ